MNTLSGIGFSSYALTSVARYGALGRPFYSHGSVRVTAPQHHLADLPPSLAQGLLS